MESIHTRHLTPPHQGIAGNTAAGRQPPAAPRPGGAGERPGQAAVWFDAVVSLPPPTDPPTPPAAAVRKTARQPARCIQRKRAGMQGCGRPAPRDGMEGPEYGEAGTWVGGYGAADDGNGNGGVRELS